MLRTLVPGALVLLTASARGQESYKLSDPLTAPPTVDGDVEEAVLTPDGRRIVYLASQEQFQVVELYSVPLDESSEAVKLNGPLVVGGEIDDFRISPDGRRVVYQADQEQVYEHALYSVPIDGSASPVRLNEPTGTHAYFDYEISADGSRVVFFDTVDFRVYVAPIEGGAPPIQLITPLRSGGYLSELALSPDGERAVFTADPNGRSGLNLYSMRIDGQANESRRTRRSPPERPRRLNAPLPPGGDILSFLVSPGGRVVYQVLAGGYDLHSVPIDGSASAVRINAPPVAGGHVTYRDYGLSPDGERVVYRADQETDEVYELYSVPIGGGSLPVKLNGPLAPGGDVWYQGFEVSPDSRLVVYRADQDSDGVTELYRVPLDGSASAVKLNAPLAPSEFLESFRISPDGARVVYLTAQECHEHLELYSVAIDGGSRAVKLNGSTRGACGPFVEEDDPGRLEYRISPDGRAVVYLTDEDLDRVYELYSVPIDGGASPDGRAWRVQRVRPIKLNAPLLPGGAVFSFAISPLGEVVYRAGQESATVLELFGVPLEGGAAPRKLNPRLALGPAPGDVVAAAISPDGARVVYRADPAIDEVFELFSVPIGGAASPVRLSPGSVTDFQIAPRSHRVVHLARRGAALELFSAPIDGSAEPIMLNGPLVAGGDVLSFQVSPDGERVAYVADQDTDGVSELYSAPIAGGASAVKLNGSLVPGGDVVDCASQVHPHSHFTPDGSHLLYLADQDRNDVFELYVVAADGSASPVKLNGPLAAGGDVAFFATCFQIGAAGDRVVYQADQDTNDVFELYSAPIDGGSSPIKLNAPLVPEGDVSFVVDGVQLSPLGDRVVYRADQEEDGRFELYSVPIDGSSAPIKLNGTLVAGGDVSSALAPRISPDGARVVYRADQERDGRAELYSVPIDASQPAVRLSALPADNRSIEAFEISPDGKRVVYQADQQAGQVFGLYGVPIDGSAPAVELFPPGPPVHSFRIAPDGKQVVFASFELHAVSILGTGSPVRLSGPTAGTGAPVFQIAPGGRRVIYLTDQDTPWMSELYASLLPRLRTREVP